MNFYDTANGHSNGASEIILGRAIKKFNWRRSNIVIATKLWLPVGYGPTDNPLSLSVEEREAGGYINEFGLSRKHIFDSVDASLKRLDLDYYRLAPNSSTRSQHATKGDDGSPT
jgi:aryl-alcohol dehydrogenase-like predicted oxidoreductase